MNLFTNVQRRNALLLSLSLFVAACNAQKPAQPTSTTSATPLTSATAPQFSEPAVAGKIIDAATKLPIQGALIYGFYATRGGGTLAGGSKFGEHVKSFEAETDANGIFKLEAWDTGTRQISGTMGTKFPMIAIYKPGYDLWFDNQSSIKQYRPKSGVVGTDVEIKDGVRDWTKFPHQLVPLTSELDRYNALDNSYRIMMFNGECGWEAYTKTLLAQHIEKKNMILRIVPTQDIDADGYLKSGRPHPIQFVDFLSHTGVDQLTKRFSESFSAWKCRNPKIMFVVKN